MNDTNNKKPNASRNEQNRSQGQNRGRYVADRKNYGRQNNRDKDRNNKRSKDQRNNQNNGRNSFQRNNNYGFPRVENEPKEERAPVLSVPVDDHPRAMVLPFDQKAVDDVRPRKYTSGFEIFKISMTLARWLTADDYLNKLSDATGLTFMDKVFLKVDGEALTKLKTYSDSRLADTSLEKAIRPFYKYMSYFATYAIENKTAVVFDL